MNLKKINNIEKIILDVDKKIKRTYWTNKEIDKWFGKRSANEIIENGTTCFMNPCLDLNLVSASMMFSKNIPYNLVIEEHLPTKKFDFRRLHFVLEFEIKKDKYFLNYKTCNDVYISKGIYTGRKDIPFSKIVRISGEKINPNKSIYKNLNYKSLNELLSNKFPNFSLESNINRLKKDNSKENYSNFKKIYGEKFLIFKEF